MATKVKNYTTKQLLDRVQKINGFKGFPSGYWILGVRSIADTYNTYDDKFYIFCGSEFIMVLTGTTNSGAYGILNFANWDKRGVAHIKADEWYYNVWQDGLHNGKMPALRQVGGFLVARDNNKNKKLGDVGKYEMEYNRGLNFHCNDYSLTSKVKNWIIGSWSTGCQVSNDVQKYVEFMNKKKPQKLFTYCLINEF